MYGFICRLSSRQILVLRAYCKYLLQIGIPFSQAYMEETLARNPELARFLAELFDARFDPDASKDRTKKVAALETTIREGLEAVANLDEDRILRRYMRLILRRFAPTTINSLKTVPSNPIFL